MRGKVWFVMIPSVLSAMACLTPPLSRDATNQSPPEPTAVPPSATKERKDLGANSDVMVFLLIGQSNMVGAPKPEPEDEVEDPRVVMLAYAECENLERSYNHWYTAKPPLHGCYAGVGPGDYFGKALAGAYPKATIGLVPLGINGVDIDFFLKGAVSARRREFRIPPDNHWSGAYEWVLERARLAQQVGKIRGILFHQGESDTGSSQWVGKVKQLVTDLRQELGIGEVPFVAGELLRTGCCGAGHNPFVNLLRTEIGNSKVVSAERLNGLDAAHFDLASQRELGARYGAAMIELLQHLAQPTQPTP